MYKTGDILHCSGRGIIAKGIALFTRSSITHSAMIVELNNEICVIEMQKNGCEIKTFDNWIKEYNYTFKASRRLDYIPTIEDILNYSGFYGYDFINLIIRQPIKLIRSFISGKGIVLNRVKNEDKRMICSELVASLMKFDNPQNYTPIDIFIECQKYNYIQIQ